MTGAVFGVEPPPSQMMEAALDVLVGYATAHDAALIMLVEPDRVGQQVTMATYPKAAVADMRRKMFDRALDTGVPIKRGP
ncbi:MAG: hypothetical protein LBB58_02435 [Cellulomonadaceae bacterium]|jgi:pentose-5-phosphate-3-epimerase|nr:hypothetical protein [Cellulomonadaceae bacterium]